jgi:hypothetical protein
MTKNMSTFLVTAAAVLAGIWLWSKFAMAKKVQPGVGPAGYPLSLKIENTTPVDTGVFFGPNIDPQTGAYLAPGISPGAVAYPTQKIGFN